MEMKKNFVINAAFYCILAALALVFWKYLLPILMQIGRASCRERV